MKTNSTIRGIAHGHMTKDNLTGFASMMTSDARTLSLARIAMNQPVYLDMGEEPSDEYTRISKLSAAYCGLLGRVNKSLSLVWMKSVRRKRCRFAKRAHKLWSCLAHIQIASRYMNMC